MEDKVAGDGELALPLPRSGLRLHHLDRMVAVGNGG